MVLMMAAPVLTHIAARARKVRSDRAAGGSCLLWDLFVRLTLGAIVYAPPPLAFVQRPVVGLQVKVVQVDDTVVVCFLRHASWLDVERRCNHRGAEGCGNEGLLEMHGIRDDLRDFVDLR